MTVHIAKSPKISPFPNLYDSSLSFKHTSPVKLWFNIKVIATEFLQRHLIVGTLLKGTQSADAHAH